MKRFKATRFAATAPGSVRLLSPVYRKESCMIETTKPRSYFCVRMWLVLGMLIGLAFGVTSLRVQR